MRVECDICGNEIPGDTLHCPFCNNRQEREVHRKLPGTHRVINIENGKPTVEAALQKLDRDLELARREHVIVATIIHGYGASGRGGVIRLECRKYLAHLQERRKIRTFIPGEEFSKKEGRTRSLMRRLPQLTNSENLNKKNRGITVVEL
ncbi:MAG: Smr/MutS family protein [Desulfocapsaceae bacterium]|nr:Smr/MutS family protein [Desulfocapsaceae bacterium]